MIPTSYGVHPFGNDPVRGKVPPLSPLYSHDEQGGLYLPQKVEQASRKNFLGQMVTILRDYVERKGVEVALREYDQTYRAESDEALREHRGLGGGTGTGY